jgi:hypothetical protein
VSLVAIQLKVIETELIDFGNLRVDFHLWKREWIPGELKFGLFEVVGVEMKVAEGMDEFPRFVSADLGHHHGEKSVGGDVKRHSQKKIRAALVELAAQARAL